MNTTRTRIITFNRRLITSAGGDPSKPLVNVLVSCRNPELWKASLLIFDTIRTGFPTSPIRIFYRQEHEGALNPDQLAEVMGKTDSIKAASLWPCVSVSHSAWIEKLIKFEDDPFFVLDTDVVFWSSFEKFSFTGSLAGRRIPQFECPFTQFTTCERLHTALMYIDPLLIRTRWAKACEERLDLAPHGILDLETWNRSGQRWFHWDGRTYFHDTMGQYYQLCRDATTPFTEEQLNCYDHLNCGTYADLVDEKLPGFRVRLEDYLNNPDKLKGRWKDEDEWYAANAAGATVQAAV